jgi:hypothetical protein
VKRLLQRMIREDDGVLSFEWVLMFTVLVIGIVMGVAAARDGVVEEIGDAAEAMVALDQSYYVDFPLQPSIIDPDLGMTAPNAGASDSGFTDFGVAFDCTRGNNAPQGQAAVLDEN